MAVEPSHRNEPLVVPNTPTSAGCAALASVDRPRPRVRRSHASDHRDWIVPSLFRDFLPYNRASLRGLGNNACVEIKDALGTTRRPGGL
jgi:hypothetical protein